MGELRRTAPKMDGHKAGAVTPHPGCPRFALLEDVIEKLESFLLTEFGLPPDSVYMANGGVVPTSSQFASPVSVSMLNTSEGRPELGPSRCSHLSMG